MNAWLETPVGDRIPLQGTCHLGRAPGNTVVLAGKQISRRHALIHAQRGGEHWLVDLGSSNGVQLNGRRLKVPLALKAGDQITIGAHPFVYRRDENAAPPEAPAGTAFMPTIRAQRNTAIWMVIADIQSFTPMSQRLPGDQLACLVGGWIMACKEVVEQHGGEIYQYLGDGFMAYWSAEVTPVESIGRTLADLKKIQSEAPPRPASDSELDGWIDQLAACHRVPFRLVVHTGTVTVDHAMADGGLGLVGAPMNFVFRMEKLAGALGEKCLVSADAAERLRALVPVAPRGEHELSGFSGKHAMFAV